MRLILLSHDQPPSHVLADLKLGNGCSLVRLLVGRIHDAEIVGPRAHQRCPPCPELLSGRLFLECWHARENRPLARSHNLSIRPRPTRIFGSHGLNSSIDPWAEREARSGLFSSPLRPKPPQP